MSTDDEHSPLPRHRRPGRALKRGTPTPGRHVLSEQPAAPCACPDGFHEYGVHAPGRRPSGEATTTPPGAYPVEDMAAMSSSATDLLLHRATLEADAQIASYPHIVITCDVKTGAITYRGPFPTGLEALTVARRFVHQNRFVDPQWAFTLTVAPLIQH